MNYLIFGCNGMAGHMISLYLMESGHSVTGFAKKESPVVDTIIGDAMDSKLVESIVKTNKHECIINCIGVLNQNAESNKVQAVYLNSLFPHYLVELTKNTDAQVVHISTDCVFSGSRGSYKEDDIRDGTTFYDRTKALGEIDDDKNLTLRNSIVGPDINAHGIGLINWFMQQHGSVFGYTKAFWTGQTTLQLAKTIEVATKTHVHGLINAVPDTKISKYDLLRLFNNDLRKDKIEIIPSEELVVDKSLIRTNWNFNYTIPDYETMISELGVWMRAHRKLYPHYNL